MLKKSLVGLLVLLAVAGVLAWLVEFDAGELGTATLRRASASTGIDLDASEYRLNLVRGLSLENVDASARFPGGRYTMVMPAMRFQHRLASLLSGTLELERVVLSEPRIAIVTGLEPEPEPNLGSSPRVRERRERARTAPKRPLASTVELRVDELELVGGAFSFNDTVSLDGVDVLLRSPSLASGALTILHAVAATGQISIRELAFRTTTVRNIVATLDVSDGRLDLVDGAFDTEGGAFESEVHLNFNSIPARHRLTLTGRLTGVPGVVSFEGEGFGLDAANLVGEGRWLVPSGQFDAAPLWKILELADRDYEATEIPLRLAEGKMHFDGDWLRGSVGLDGELALIVNGVEVGGSWDSPVLR